MSRSEVLVSTDWLADNADRADIRIVEVDEDTEAYAVSHIPGSIAWHWSDDLHDRPRRELISQDQVHALLAKSGVGPVTTVILAWVVLKERLSPSQGTGVFCALTGVALIASQ